MAEMLTAKEMQELLNVDRSTIYRMAETGRLPAIKVGRQWRFPSDLVRNWLRGQTSASPMPVPGGESGVVDADLPSLLPVDCVRLIQEGFAEALGVMVIITDMKGMPVVGIGNPCRLLGAILNLPGAEPKLVENWRQLAHFIDLEPKLMRSDMGLLCARAMIRVGDELKGMVLVGCIAPDGWPPLPEEVDDTAERFGVDYETLEPFLSGVFYLDDERRARILSLVQRIANIISHIATDRAALMKRLESATG